MIHRHKWIEVERLFAESRVGKVKEGYSEEFAQQFAFGLTTIIHKCEKCGKLKTYKILGKSK